MKSNIEVTADVISDRRRSPGVVFLPSMTFPRASFREKLTGKLLATTWLALTTCESLQANLPKNSIWEHPNLSSIYQPKNTFSTDGMFVKWKCIPNYMYCIAKLGKEIYLVWHHITKNESNKSVSRIFRTISPRWCVVNLEMCMNNGKAIKK